MLPTQPQEGPEIVQFLWKRWETVDQFAHLHAVFFVWYKDRETVADGLHVFVFFCDTADGVVFEELPCGV